MRGTLRPFSRVEIEIINTGTELMLGRILNTHQQWLCRRFADLGYVVTRQVAVADTPADIERAVRDALTRSDLVLTTGGLGPTSDDLTREVLARMLGKPLHEDAGVLAEIERVFQRLQRPMPASTRVQALVPEGAIVLPNPNGTAPGLALELSPNPFRAKGGNSWLIMLPGPPRELHPMFASAVEPLLHREFPLDHPFSAQTLRTTGVGESALEDALQGAIPGFRAEGVEIGYCARIGQVDVRLSASGADAAGRVGAAVVAVRAILGPDIFGTGDEELEAVVIRKLIEKGKSLAVAESCTGGGIGNSLSNVPGASAAFLGGFITYSNASKERLLGVKSKTLSKHGAVSAEVAQEMAEGSRLAMGSYYAIAVTGMAGPGGGSTEKPVGTVYFALADAGTTLVWHRVNAWDRSTFKTVTTAQVLNALRVRLDLGK
jgi:nicotinamide-nucleotide amidase